MIAQMDKGIGGSSPRSRRRRARDTLVVFTSDNGGERFSDNWPLVGGKKDLPKAVSACPGSRMAGTDRAGRHQPTALHDDGLVGDDARRRRRRSPSGLSARRRLAAAGAGRIRRSLFPRPLYLRINHRGQRALRHGAGSTCGSMATTICSTSRPTSARRQPRRREPARLAAARQPGGSGTRRSRRSRRRDGEPRLRRARTCRSASRPPGRPAAGCYDPSPPPPPPPPTRRCTAASPPPRLAP